MLLTTRATVLQSLAKREAELLDQDATSAHLLVAAIWEGDGIAAQALADSGLAKGTENGLRSLLASAPPDGRGMTLHQASFEAAKIADGLGHSHLGTEHQLLAIIGDATLTDAVFPTEAREHADAYVRDAITSDKY